MRYLAVVLCAVSLAVLAPASSLTLAWTDNADNELEFVIERATGEGEFEELARTPADVTAYEDSTPQPGVTYRYRVKATNEAGDSAYSETVTAAVSPPVQEPPGPPQGIELVAPDA